MAAACKHLSPSSPSPAALCEITGSLPARIIDDACISLPLFGSGFDAEGIASNLVLRENILGMLQRIRTIF